MQKHSQEELSNPIDWVSIREFARKRGVAEGSIRHHIKMGRLEGCMDVSNPKRPLINVTLAEQALAKYVNPMYERKSDLLATDRQSSTPPGQRSLAEVKRVTAEIKMQREALTLRKEKGQLVDKDAVYAALFTAGQELRQAFTSLPDRVIDSILAAEDRPTAHGILSDAIAEVLRSVGEIEKRELVTR